MPKSVEFWESPKEPSGRASSTRIDNFKTIWKSFGIEELSLTRNHPTTMDEESLQKLLRLKRHESPPEGYFDGFLREFHRRQRQELLQRSSLSLLFERVNTYLADPKSQGWAYAPVVALFAVAFYVIIGMTADSPLPSVPSLAHLEAAEAYYAFHSTGGPAAPAQYAEASLRGPFTPMHTVNVPPGPIQAATIFDSRLQLSEISLEDLRLIGN